MGLAGWLAQAASREHIIDSILHRALARFFVNSICDRFSLALTADMVGAKKKGKIKINREKENQKEKEMEMVRTAGTRHALIARTMLAVCARFPRSPLSKSKRGDLFPLKPWKGGRMGSSCQDQAWFRVRGMAHGRSNGRARGAFSGRHSAFQTFQGPPPRLPDPQLPRARREEAIGHRAWLCPSMRDASRVRIGAAHG